MSTDSKDLCDEMYEGTELYAAEGKWLMLFGVARLPEYQCKGHASLLMGYVINEARKLKRCGTPLCPPELKSLYFDGNAEIQDFLLHTESSLNCNFAVACEEKTGKIHTNSHEIHTTIGGINVIERSQLP